jgi:hypothetical protein
MTEDSLDQHQHSGLIKTDLDCHACSKNFVAQLDYDVDGNHIIECPHCRHEHCRVIKNGVVTDDRFDSKNGDRFVVQERRIWKSSDNVLQVKTSSAANFIRQSWLNKGG